jgi:hypothetical protein
MQSRSTVCSMVFATAIFALTATATAQSPHLSLPGASLVLTQPCGKQLEDLQAAGLDVRVLGERNVGGTSYVGNAGCGDSPVLPW